MPTIMLDKKRISVKEFYELGKQDKRLELVNGEVIEMAPAGYEHCKISGKVITIINNYNSINKKGDALDSSAGFHLPNGNVRAPDVSFVRKEKVPNSKLIKGFARMSPDLAVEVLSPNERMSDVLAKVQEYLDCGTYVVWIVDIDRKTVTIHKKDASPIMLYEGDVLTEDTLLPGFTCNVKDIFE